MAQLENFRLKVFRAVAKHLNFHKAAEHLFLTQPAVTLQIKALEQDLGARLFDRAAGRISLTRGSILLGYNKMSTLAVEAEQELGCKERKVSGQLSLGVSTTIAQYVLPRLLGAFLDDYPAVEVSLRSGNTSDIVRLLLEGNIAVGLIEGPERDRGIRSEPFMQDEMVLITPTRSEDHLSGNQFLASTLLVREQGSGSRRVVLGMIGGNIFHAELSAEQLFHMRPAPGYADFRSPIRGLYQGGSATHGGGGVSGIPAYQAVKQVQSDRALKRSRNN